MNKIWLILPPVGPGAMVDEADYWRAVEYRWFFRPDESGQGYLSAAIGDNTVFLHRFVMRAEPGQIVDHISRDRLDCRKVNLRFCTAAQSASHRMSAKNLTGYRNVSRIVREGKEEAYRASFRVGGQRIIGKNRASAEEAARDYDAFAIKHLGTFAILNFPDEALATGQLDASIDQTILRNGLSNRSSFGLTRAAQIAQRDDQA